MEGGQKTREGCYWRQRNDCKGKEMVAKEREVEKQSNQVSYNFMAFVLSIIVHAYMYMIYMYTNIHIYS